MYSLSCVFLILAIVRTSRTVNKLRKFHGGARKKKVEKEGKGISISTFTRRDWFEKNKPCKWKPYEMEYGAKGGIAFVYENLIRTINYFFFFRNQARIARKILFIIGRETGEMIQVTVNYTLTSSNYRFRKQTMNDLSITIDPCFTISFLSFAILNFLRRINISFALKFPA